MGSVGSVGLGRSGCIRAGNVWRRRPVLAVRSRFGAAGWLSRLAWHLAGQKGGGLWRDFFPAASRKYFFRLARLVALLDLFCVAGAGGRRWLSSGPAWLGLGVRGRAFPEHYRTGAETVCIVRGASAANSGKGLLPEYLFFFGKKV